MPDIKLHSNPSAFNVYCNVRHCVLDWQQREASLVLASRSSVQSGDSDSEEEEEYREPAVKLPKVWAQDSPGCLCSGTALGITVRTSLCSLSSGGTNAFSHMVYVELIFFYCVDNWSHFTIGLKPPSCED